MMPTLLNIVVLGLSITSSWGNGHATTYRALLRQLSLAGHRLLFLERDVPWYSGSRDLPNPPFCRTELYASVDELRTRFQREVEAADLVVVGSFVPDGIEVGEWVLKSAGGVRVYYDIDTPVTLARLEAGTCEYLALEQVGRYDLYLSFSGGPILLHLERALGSPRARALYCSVDLEAYRPLRTPDEYDLGYLGTYSADRQDSLDRLLLDVARHWDDGRFAVAGPQYPETVQWPRNVKRIEHLPPSEHCTFYCSQRFTLNLTRADMIRAGHAPSVRLFEAAACGVPVISDYWPGLEEFFEPGRDILLAQDGREVGRILRAMSDRERLAIGRNGRRRVLAGHTSRHRAEQLLEYVSEARGPQHSPARVGT